MKDKMVLNCLKLKQNSFKPLKQSMFTYNKNVLIVLDTLKKCIQKKTVKQKRKLFRQRIEASTGGVLGKKVFLKISQNSQEGLQLY